MRETATGLDAGLATTTPLSMTPAMPSDNLPIPALESKLKPEHQVDFSKFTPEQMRRIQNIAASVSLDDTGSMMSYAMEPQMKVNEALDSLLEGVTAADAGAVGDLTIELATSIKVINLQKMKREANGQDWFASSFGKLPLLGQYFSAFRHFQLTHKKITAHLDRIVGKANTEFTRVKAGVDKLDHVFDVTLGNINDLELYLAAGHIVLEHGRKEYARRAELARQRRNPVEYAALQDFQGRIDTFETRVVRIHLGVADALLTLPQIRQTQKAGGITMFSIMDTLLFDMPKLKNLILMLAAVKSIRDANASESARQKVLQQMDQIAGDAVSDVYLSSLQSQNGGIARLAQLSEKANTILQTIARGAEIEAQNAITRKKIVDGVGEVKRKFVADLQAQSEKFIRTQAAL
jgi:uncharacterized protein YaaN involved in tellurite resistance